MPRLFTYTIPVDDGAAPNPFHGMCSLAICKPGIRRVAQPNDWVAGLGSKNAPYFDQFVSWVRTLVSAPGQLYGWPDHVVEWGSVSACGGCTPRKLDDEFDPDC